MKDNTIPLTLIGILADGEFHSGEQLGEQLGMSRAAINKHIQTLRDWGVDVFTVPGKGYSLPEPIQLLNEEIIRSQIGHGNVAVLPVIDSTNQYLLDRLSELKSGDACVAEYQQAGRGRRGVSGSHHLAPTSTFPCTGGLNRASCGHRAEHGHRHCDGRGAARSGCRSGAGKMAQRSVSQRSEAGGDHGRTDGKTGDAAQIVIGAGLNMVMRNVQNDVVNRARPTYRKRGSPSIAIRLPSA